MPVPSIAEVVSQPDHVYIASNRSFTSPVCSAELIILHVFPDFSVVIKISLRSAFQWYISNTAISASTAKILIGCDLAFTKHIVHLLCISRNIAYKRYTNNVYKMYINIYKNILAKGLTYVGSTNHLTHQICHIGDLRYITSFRATPSNTPQFRPHISCQTKCLTKLHKPGKFHQNTLSTFLFTDLQNARSNHFRSVFGSFSWITPPNLTQFVQIFYQWYIAR